MTRAAFNPTPEVSTDTRTYGIIRAMSVPQLARHIGLEPKRLWERINAGEGPKVIRMTGAKRDTIRVLPCHAIAWLRTMEE